MSSLKEGQTDTPGQEILPKVEDTSASSAPVWETFPLPTITNVFSMGTPQKKVNLKESLTWWHGVCHTVIKSLNNGSVAKKIQLYHHSPLPVKVIKKRLRAKIWNSDLPVVEFGQHLTSAVSKCISVLLNNIPLSMKEPLHIKTLILLKTDFDPFTKQTMDVRILKPAPPSKRAGAMLLFSNNEDCMKVYYGLHGLLLLNKKVDVTLDWGGTIAKNNNFIYRSQNERKEAALPPIDNISHNGTDNETSEVQNNGNNKDSSETSEVQNNNNNNKDSSKTSEVQNNNSNNKDSSETSEVQNNNKDSSETSEVQNNNNNNKDSSKTSEVQNNNRNNKDSSDKLATNGTVETVPIKQEPAAANEVDISEPTKEEPNVTDLEIGKAITEDFDSDFDVKIEEQEVDMIDLTNDAECDPDGKAEGDTKCTVVHVKGLIVNKAYDTIMSLMMCCNCFDTTKKIFYFRLLHVGWLTANKKNKINGECLLKFTTHSDAVQVCDYLNTTRFEAKLDIGNAISESEEPILIYSDGPTKKPFRTKFSDQWLTIDLRYRNREDKNVNNYETYGLSMDILKALNLPPQGPLTNTIMISNLSPKVKVPKLMEVFSMAGQIKHIYTYAVRLQGNNIARIEYDHPVEAVQAISMFSKRKLFGKAMKVRMNLYQFTMPVGLEDVGEGLGKDGTPLKDVRANILENKVFGKLAETKRFESTNGAHLTANKEPCNKTANTDVTSILSTVIESLRDAATAHGLLQSETNSKVFADVISALEKHQQSGTINKPVASSSYQGVGKPTVDTESNFGTYNSKSKKENSSNAQNSTANLANPQQNSEKPTNPSNHLSNPQKDTVKPVIETNKAPNALIFGSQQTNVTSSPTIIPHPNVQYSFQNNSNYQNPPPFANIPTNPGANAVIQSVSNYMSYFTPTSNYTPTNIPQNYVPNPNPAYIPNPAPMTMNYQSAPPILYDRTQMTANMTVPNQVVPPKQIIWVPGNAERVSSYGHVATDMASLHPPLPPIPEALRSEPPSMSETPNKIQKVTNVNQKQIQDSVNIFNERLKRILASIQQTHNTNPQKAPQPSQSKYKTESYEKGKKEEISRKRDYEGKVTNGMAGNTDDTSKLKPVLCFRNLPDSVSTEALTMKMQEVGDLTFSQVIGKGRAVVSFKTIKDSERCIQLFHRSKVDGQTIEVQFNQKL